MKKQYVRSERAHYMCPNMHFGIAFQPSGVYNQDKLRAVLDRLAAAHPFLQCLIAQEENGALYYAPQNRSTIALTVRSEMDDLWADYRAIGKTEWNVFRNGMLKVYVYPAADGTFRVLFVAHHLLCDGRGLLRLVCEFADDYGEGKVPAYVEEELITSIADLPPKSDLSGISKWLVRWANKKWQKENHRVSYEDYAVFAEKFAAENPFDFRNCTVNVDKMTEIRAWCRKQHVSVNDYLMTVLYEAANTEKIVIGADIRPDVSCYHPGAMGNYSSAIGIVCPKKLGTLAERAQKVRDIVAKSVKQNKVRLLVLACYLNMNPDLLDAVAIATLGGFSSDAAKFVGTAMFGFAARHGVSMTNLGQVKNPNIQSAMFIPPLSPSAKEVLGVLTMNGQMNITAGFYTDLVPATEMQAQLDAFVR